MVRIEFHRNETNGSIRGFTVCGHAGAGSRGNDIVCAAVSALTQACVLGLQRVLQLPGEAEWRQGWLSCRYDGGGTSPAAGLPVAADSRDADSPDTERREFAAQVLFRTLFVALSDLAATHPQHVQVTWAPPGSTGCGGRTKPEVPHASLDQGE
ncbi:MAG: ribosomal-processing cysteine protease Prp [Firmicutes bacterium]|nr:ribosomal-processing cysteine protease Prp [Bacillota bacterium]